MRNKEPALSIKENYFFLLRIKLSDLIFLSLIYSALNFVYFSFIVGFVVLFLINVFVLKEKILYQIATLINVIAVMLFISVFFVDLETNSLSMFVLVVNFLVPVATFAIFALGDVILHYVDIAPIEVSLDMRITIVLAVIILFLSMRLYEFVIRKYPN